MKKLVLLCLLVAASFQMKAQLFIDGNYTLDQMIHGFFDSTGVAISNVSYTGAPGSLAFFEGSQSNIGLNAGLLITTGQAGLAVGPNDSQSAGANMGVPGTPWLNDLIPGYYTYDASVIEMDVVPTTDTLCFKYVFASEEYKEFVNTQFNDLFAFLVEGPGLPVGDSIYVPADTVYVQSDSSNCYTCVDTFIMTIDTFCYFDSIQMTTVCWADTFIQTLYCYDIPGCTTQYDTIIYPGYWYTSSGGVNIAMVPNTNLAVSINNLNQFVNTQYFVDNAVGTTVQYDAFTTPLWAKLAVTPGATYHVRVAIADAGDGVFDSGVFLGIESLGGDSLLTVIPQFELTAPGNNNTVTFQNNSLWGTEYSWDFGDGTTSLEKNPVHTFNSIGAYEVKLKVSNWCSSKTYVQSVQIGASATNEPASDIFRAFPNPTRGAFTLDLKKATDARLIVTRLDGQLVMEDQVQDGAQIDLNRFGKGVYQLQVISDGKVYTERIVNQ